MQTNDQTQAGEILRFYSFINREDINSIEIPSLQRDYAQGRKSAASIRQRLIADLRNALIEESASVFLDCVYGVLDNGKFIPIDGQQRLTTLFLLHWYVAVRSGRLDEQKENLKKFTYEVRDSAREFCEFLPQTQVQISDSVSSAIRNLSWYHSGVFDIDPTVNGMLVTLDEIHEYFRNDNSGELYGKLFSDNCPVSFWWLKIENFGQADDLFVKMNARGKKLTMFERFKAAVEDILRESPLSAEWKEKIDNEWLEGFWNKFTEGNTDTARTPADAEDEMFRFILFAAYVFRKQEGDSNFQWNSTPQIDNANFSYDYAVEILKRADNLGHIVSMLNVLPIFCNSDVSSEIRDDFDKIISGSGDVGYSSVAKVYAVLSFCICISDIEWDLFNDYNRVLNNLLTAQRRFDKPRTAFRDYIDQNNIGIFTKRVDEFIRQIKEYGSINEALRKSESELSGFDEEVEKAAYIDEHGKDEICALENIDELRGLIHNFFYDGKIWFTVDRMGDIYDNKTKFLQLLQIYYNKNPCWDVSISWVNGRIDFMRYWFKESRYGDIILTYGEADEFQEAIRTCIKKIGSSGRSIVELLEEARKELVFSNPWSYIGKYDEFFDEDSVCCRVPHNNEYHMVVCHIATESKGWQWNEIKYNPFCKALANKLGMTEPKFVGEYMETLRIDDSNHITIQPDGNWVLFDGKNEIHIPLTYGQDIIEQAAVFAKSHFSI